MKETTENEFLEEIERLNSLLFSGMFDRNEVTKKSVATYLRVLESAKVFPSDFEDLFGKWVLIYENDICPQYFNTPQDTFEEDPKYLLFQIPSLQEKSNKSR
jgi:hypothetical protein